PVAPRPTLSPSTTLFRSRNCVDIRIGQPVPFDSYQRVAVSPKEKAQLFRRHLYRMGQDKDGVFATEEAIAHPENRVALREEVRRCERLGETGDGKQIYLYRYQPDSSILREIGRLRELTFRAVG